MYPSIARSSTIAFTAAIVLFIAGCTKTELNRTVPTSPSAAQTIKAANTFASDDEFTTEVTASGTTIVKYRPGPDDGEDVYTDFYRTVGSGNQNYVPELPINVWDFGGPIITRSFIKFPKLYKFPIH